MGFNRVLNISIIIFLVLNIIESLVHAIQGDFMKSFVDYAWIVCYVILIKVRKNQGIWIKGDFE